jgi:endonuclease YncB( thermonuclease family)
LSTKPNHILRTTLLVMTTVIARPAHAQEPINTTSSLCRNELIDRGRVQTVIDGRTFTLTDGREIRLAGIEVPAPQAAGSRLENEAGDAAKAGLEALLAGVDVILKGPGTSFDRYGRLLAHAFAARNGQEQSIAQAMLAAGLGWVSPRIDAACAAEFFASERAARAAKLGLWNDPYYEIKSAENPADILAEQGRFALVEGRVVSVRESRGIIYINFGRRWTEDFTATVSKHNEHLLTNAGLDPKKLQNRRIRIRGWIEERGGPWIELTRPQQIEIVEGN